MTVIFYIPSYLRSFTNDRSEVAVESASPTVGDALTALYQRHPGLRDRVMDELGVVRPHVNIFVEDESIRYTGGLATPVVEGSKIHIVPAVSGGVSAG